MYIKLNADEVGSKTNGSSLSGNIYTTYSELVKFFGSPTYQEPSGDDKVQKEWVFEDEDKNIFTVYDWKTYDVNYTMNENQKWNVGSKVSAYNFIEWVERKLKS